MASAFIDYTSRDFDTIRTSLMAYIRMKYPSQWTEFSEGSLGMAMLELVAFVGDQLNFYLDVMANESFLPTARDRSSIIKLCNLIGYKLRSPTASSLVVTATITSALSNNIIIAAGTPFTSKGGITFEFLSEQVISAGQTEVEFTATAGQSTSDTFTSDGTDFQSFKATKSGDINGSIVVTVDGSEWTETEALVYGDDTSSFYTLDHDADGYAVITFGDGTNGAAPAAGATILVSYRINGGVSGNISIGQINTDITGILEGVGDPVTVHLENFEKGTGGEEQETEDHARLWAPRWVKTNGRAVTAEDFETLAIVYNDPYIGSPAFASAKLKYEVPESNAVELRIWTRDNNGDPIPLPAGSSLATGLQDYFDNNGVGAVRLVCLDTEILPGINVYLDISVSIVVESDYSTTTVITEVQTAIESLIESMIPGQNFRISKLYEAIQSVNGVSHSLINYVKASFRNSGVLGTADGTALTYTGNLFYTSAAYPLENSVLVECGSETLVDDGEGNLTGTAGSGTIDYETGDYSITFTGPVGYEVTLYWRSLVNYDRNEQLQTLDGTSSLIRGSLSYPPVNPGSVAIAIGNVTVIDDGNGNLSGTGVVSGTIDYDTGSYRIQLVMTPPAGTAVHTAYQQILNTASEDIPVDRGRLAVEGYTTVVSVREDE